jgi:hypothetical protein
MHRPFDIVPEPGLDLNLIIVDYGMRVRPGEGVAPVWVKESSSQRGAKPCGRRGCYPPWGMKGKHPGRTMAARSNEGGAVTSVVTQGLLERAGCGRSVV